METLNYQKVENKNNINLVAQIAKEIWTEYYLPIIGKKQLNHMLTHIQSATAIEELINSGYEYYIIEFESKNVGYIGVEKRKEELFLSKFYIKSAYRSKGIGSKTMKFIENYALDSNLKKITLTVSKHNQSSINIYKKVGFNIKEPIVIDIGDGYIMDDYLMEKSL